jgi:hypothetical protein
VLVDCNLHAATEVRRRLPRPRCQAWLPFMGPSLGLTMCIGWHVVGQTKRLLILTASTRSEPSFGRFRTLIAVSVIVKFRSVRSMLPNHLHYPASTFRIHNLVKTSLSLHAATRALCFSRLFQTMTKPQSFTSLCVGQWCMYPHKSVTVSNLHILSGRPIK